MAEDTVSELTDLAIRLKDAFEAKKVSALKSLFVPQPKINVMGRFLAEEEFLERLAQFFKQVEEPILEIMRIEETDVQKKSAFIAYDVEVSFIHEQTWEEHTINGLLGLSVARKKETQRGKSKDQWLVDGLTFSKRPDVGRTAGAPQPAGPTAPTGRTLGLFDGLFGLWY